MGALDFLTKLPARRNAAQLPAKPARSVPAPVAVAELPADARGKAAERLRFVRLVEIVKASRRLSDADACEFVAVNHALEFPILRRSGHGGASQLTYNNLRNWRPAVRQGGGDDEILRRLADGYTRGIQKARGDARFWEYFYAFYLNLNRLPISVAYRNAAAKMRAIDPTVRIPTPAQVRYRVGQLDPAVVILAREGEEACKNRCIDYIKRDWRDIPAGEVVVGDSRTFDTRVRVLDPQTGKYRAARPTIAALIDGRSWFMTAYWITTEPVNAETLIRTLALHCLNTGGQPPAVAYFDNGKDYCAQGFSTPLVVDGVEHSIFRELGITLVNSIAYNARAKTIERAFRDMMQQFDKMFPDYLGSRPGERTLAADYFDTHPEELPDLDLFCRVFADWLDSYHATPKSGDIHRGKSPAEIWNARQPRPAMSAEQLRLAVCKPEGVRTVGRGPAVSLDGKLYYCDRLKVGTKALVKSDPFDPTRVLCYTPDGALIGEARTRDAIRALALDDEEARAAISELIGRQRRQLREARTTLDRLTGGRSQASPIELFLADPDAPLVPVGSRRSVKGAAHEFTRFTLPGTIEPAPKAQDRGRKLEFREDEEEERRREFGRAIMTPPTAPEDKPDPQQLQDFNQFMTSRRDDEF